MVSRMVTSAFHGVIRRLEGIGAPRFCPSTAVFAPCSSHTALASWLYQFSQQKEGC
jgi:hypothetical protein